MPLPPDDYFSIEDEPAVLITRWRVAPLSASPNLITALQLWLFRGYIKAVYQGQHVGTDGKSLIRFNTP